jgi:hypothetical protein
VELVRQAYGGMAEQYIEQFGSIAQVHADDLALITRHLLYFDLTARLAA